MKGEHVTNHKERAWNCIWSEMLIEMTSIKFGEGRGGIIGVATQSRTFKVWPKSQHIRNTPLCDLEKLCNMMRIQIKFKRKKARHIALDQKTLKGIIKTCIYSPGVESHSENILCNI